MADAAPSGDAKNKVKAGIEGFDSSKLKKVTPVDKSVIDKEKIKAQIKAEKEAPKDPPAS